MTIRPTTEADWPSLKAVRLAALLDAPTAFGVSHQKRCNLTAVWVAPQARGSGIAGQLVDAAKAHAVRQGHDHVFLDLAPDKERAARFYRKHGFVFIDEWSPLASHPHIQVQTMHCKAGA